MRSRFHLYVDRTAPDSTPGSDMLPSRKRHQSHRCCSSARQGTSAVASSVVSPAAPAATVLAPRRGRLRVGSRSTHRGGFRRAAAGADHVPAGLNSQRRSHRRCPFGGTSPVPDLPSVSGRREGTTERWTHGRRNTRTWWWSERGPPGCSWPGSRRGGRAGRALGATGRGVEPHPGVRGAHPPPPPVRWVDRRRIRGDRRGPRREGGGGAGCATSTVPSLSSVGADGVHGAVRTALARTQEYFGRATEHLPGAA